MPTRYVSLHRGRNAAPTTAQRLLAAAALGSLATLGVAAGPAAAATPGSSQGASQSDPDGMSNGGADKPGGTGGVNKADQDGNNGSGNDSDCEDDNNGRGTPGSCDAHARNQERRAAREQSGGRDSGSGDVTARGRLFVRNICMTFDKYLPGHAGKRIFSRTV